MTSPDTTAKEQPQTTVGAVSAETTTHSELFDENTDLETDDDYADSAIGTDSS